jgi:hypothetical protein
MFLGPSESPTIGEGRAEFAAKLPFEGGCVRSGEVQDQGSDSLSPDRILIIISTRLDSTRLAISGYDTFDEDGRKVLVHQLPTDLRERFQREHASIVDYPGTVRQLR